MSSGNKKKSDEKISDKKILKVIYYDENAAIDYVTIMNEGNITVEEINKAMSGSNVDAGIEGSVSVKTSLLKMLNLSSGVKAEASVHKSNEKIVNSTITTNIMTEFIKLADEDDNIEKLTDFRLHIDKDTLTYLKSVFPYLSLLKDPEKIDELKEINIEKIDEVILSTKGYFEFLAYKDNEEEAVLRFNVDCFRNNYKFGDLLKMDLCYYGIKVGKTKKEELKLENEINTVRKVLSEEDLSSDKTSSNTELSIYDIIIAGVKND